MHTHHLGLSIRCKLQCNDCFITNSPFISGLVFTTNKAEVLYANKVWSIQPNDAVWLALLNFQKKIKKEREKERERESAKGAYRWQEYSRKIIIHCCMI